MGFSFRRGASFGPLRLNVSKSGVGASIGVKGARVTLTPRGRTYIKVGATGFSYRQSLNSAPRAEAQPPFTNTQAVAASDQIITADVEQLRESSKSELVTDLNRRARMFNPAIVVFVVAALCGIFGIAELGNALPGTLPALPNISADANDDRQRNTADEYALLVARYGQPSTVHLSQAGSTPLREATWSAANVTMRFVPVGCVDAYRFYKAYKDDVVPARSNSRRRGHPAAAPVLMPACNMGTQGSTVVGYENTQTRALIDAWTAASQLANVTAHSAGQPAVTMDQAPESKVHAPKTSASMSVVNYDMPTFENEQNRIQATDIAGKTSIRTGVLSLIGAVLIFIPGVLIHRKNKEKRTTELIYDLSDSARTQHEAMEGAVGQLGRSAAIWRLDSQSAITDWKRNAGAAYNVQRHRVAMRRSSPLRVVSNVEPMCLDLGKTKLFFLPDQVLYWQRGMFAAVEYGDFKIASASIRFIEEAVQTSDSQQVGSTWRYVRKDGGQIDVSTTTGNYRSCCTESFMRCHLEESTLFSIQASLIRPLPFKRCSTRFR